MPKDKGKQNPNEYYTKKCQKHVASSYGYKLVCVYDRFSLLNSVLLAVWSKKVNIVVMWWKNILTKNLWWLKKITKILRTLINVGSVIMITRFFIRKLFF